MRFFGVGYSMLVHDRDPNISFKYPGQRKVSRNCECCALTAFVGVCVCCITRAGSVMHKVHNRTTHP